MDLHDPRCIWANESAVVRPDRRPNGCFLDASCPGMLQGGGNSRAVELTIGIVSGTVVALLLAVLAGLCLLWRRARRRAAAGITEPNGTRWSKSEALAALLMSKRT